MTLEDEVLFSRFGITAVIPQVKIKPKLALLRKKMIPYTKKIYKAILGVFLCVLGVFLAPSCGTVRTVPIEYREVTNYIDSLVLRDSVVIIPVERIRDIVPVYDTLTLETSVAKSVSYVDTMTHSLKGKLENKQDKIVKYVYKDRYIEKIDTVYIEKPVEITKDVKYIPKFYKRTTSGFFIILLGLIIGFAFKIYFKFK